MLIILHGWSDTYTSFKKLASWILKQNIYNDIHHIYLGNYVSLDDDVTFNDLVEAMQAAWINEYLPTEPRSVDVIVHSSGGLVVRDWMTSYYKHDTNPVHRLLMLAPANFGSHLAHKGKSFIGRVFKGYKSDKPFQTGTHILNGLELASPYSWELARRDLFGGSTWYGPGKVLCTVLIGTEGYSGISSIGNQSGSDGTVPVSCANLNASRLVLDFATDPQNPTARPMGARGVTAFTRIPLENHSTIAFKDNGPKNEKTYELILNALTVTDDSFDSHCDELDAISSDARLDGEADPYTHGYQNTVVHLVDNLETDVKDYFLELFIKEQNNSITIDDSMTSILQENVVTKVHIYKENSAYRSLMINCTRLDELSPEISGPLCIAITALPDINQTKSVGYDTFAWDAIDSLKLDSNTTKQFFKCDRTVLVEFSIKRKQTEKVFSFNKHPK
jgi:hypothetical protein